MLFIIRQQVQPDFIIVVMQSQQAWIMSQHILSPEVHIIVMPSAVISHLHMPMVSEKSVRPASGENALSAGSGRLRQVSPRGPQSP